MSSPSINVQLVQTTVSGAVGQAVAAVQRLQGSVSNQDFVVRLADATQLVVKAGPATELAAEAWACRRLTALGVPVPDVIAVNLDAAELGLPFLSPRDRGDRARLTRRERVPRSKPQSRLHRVLTSYPIRSRKSSTRCLSNVAAASS